MRKTIPPLCGAFLKGKDMRNVLLAGAAGLFIALGMAGAARADSDSVSPVRYATALPSFFSSRSPLLADHYGYDDRDTNTQVIEGRAASLEGGTAGGDRGAASR
jgi:hypothetical protein